jgi:ABC-type transport system substrate-binding protein/DNA-binding SARP family transcriptional activator/DNA-binding beta-propeller fold protein YncE
VWVGSLKRWGVGTGLDFRVLGPLEVRLGGTLVRVGGPRQRALLGLLLCHANRVLSRGQLIDELLSDQSPASADRMLRVQVSRLRKVLADDDAEPRLMTRPPGYLLRVEDGELDLQVFEKRLAAGRRALEVGDAGQASALLREAESLWRGRPLADLEFEQFARFEIQRLEALRLLAVEDRIEAELALGRHAVLCPELEHLVDEHPLRERLRGQLMLALYRSGRQAEALETYRVGRLLLIDELAVEPGPQLKQLQAAILGQDAAIQVPPPGASPNPAPRTAPAVEAAPQTDLAEQTALTEPVHGEPPRLRRRAKLLAGLVAGSAAAAAVVALGPMKDHANAHHNLTGNLLALISPASGALQATVPLRASPADVSLGAGSLWVAEPTAGLVVRINPTRAAVTMAIPTGTRPSRIIVVGGQVWVLDPADRTVSRIDPQTSTVEQTIALDSEPTDFLATAGSLWVATRSGTVERIDPATGRTLTTVRTGGDPSGMAAASGVVWVATDQSGNVLRIDALTGAVTGTIRVGDAPAAISAGPAGLWVLDPLDATVSLIDPQRDTVVKTVPLGGAPDALSQSGGSVWIADGQNASLLRLEPRRDTVTRFHFDERLSALVPAGGGIWAAADAIGPDLRGGTLISINSFAPVDTIDPAAGTSLNVPPPQLSGLTNDGLVTLNHAAGPAGSRLVPDLAVALPVPTGGGRIYTFHLRPGIRYSDGALVRPADVVHSFERIFQQGSSGAAYFQAIAGAAACQAAPTTCDLSRGIVADNRAGTVTFHLSRPDPDFLYKLTLAYADVLPASTPGRQARTPLPATGPYMISRYIPGRQLLLTRNPRFREWSAAAQPAGYPDRILIRLNLSAAEGAESVAHGAADFMPNLGQAPADAAFFLRHHNQLRVNPQIETSFLFLNVNAPPFNDLRVRQAVNLALDRALAVDGYGGPLAAQPTCQILPPSLAGYHRYCPYTRDPTADGQWHGTDLARARRLVAASGTAGMRVTVWNSPGPAFTAAETRDTVTALRQLGYRASLRLLPDSTYFTYTNDSRNRAQAIDGGWSADYPSADDFIGKLACSAFVPGNGQATTDASEFCDPRLDQQAARAAALQTTDPLAAAARWTELDRKLTDLAIWLPTVTPNETDLISSRVGNYQYNPVWGPLIDQMSVR